MDLEADVGYNMQGENVLILNLGRDRLWLEKECVAFVKIIRGIT